MTILLVIAVLFAVGAVALVVFFLLIQHRLTTPVRQITTVTAAPIGTTWYLWLVTKEGECYRRAVSEKQLDEPLRYMGNVWTANTVDYSKL